MSKNKHHVYIQIKVMQEVYSEPFVMLYSSVMINMVVIVKRIRGFNTDAPNIFWSIITHFASMRFLDEFHAAVTTLYSSCWDL